MRGMRTTQDAYRYQPESGREEGLRVFCIIRGVSVDVESDGVYDNGRAWKLPTGTWMRNLIWLVLPQRYRNQLTNFDTRK
jgi:hypothetical protein